jgi:hypothetical protein
VEDNDLNEIAEDNAGHFDHADPDDAIPVAAEHGNQAGEESGIESLEMLDHTPADSNNDDLAAEGDDSPMLGYDDDTLTGERRSHRIAAKRSARDSEQNRHSYHVRDTYEDIAHLAEQIWGGSRRRPWRATKTVIERLTLHAYKLSVKKALLKNEKASKESITKLCGQRCVGSDRKGSPYQEATEVSHQKLHVPKEKFNGDGSFDKLKARLVAGGDGQDKSLYDNLSSSRGLQ